MTFAKLEERLEDIAVKNRCWIVSQIFKSKISSTLNVLVTRELLLYGWVNIPLVYTGQLEPESLLGWLRETHDTDTNMVKLSSRNLQRIIALERTVLVLFHLRSDSSPLIVRASSSRLDRLGVVVVTLGHIKEVAGLGVTSLPSLVMFKHGLPIIYHGDLEVTGLDQVTSLTRPKAQ